MPAPVRKGACAGLMQSESLQLAAGAMDDPSATARPAASADASTTGGVDAEDQNGSWSQREWQDRAWHAWQTDGQSRGQANGTAAASPTAGAVETRDVTAQGGADPLLASDPWATSRTSSTPAAAPSSSAPAAAPWLPATTTTSDSAAISNGWSWSWRSQWDQWGSHGWTRDDGWQSSSWSSTHYKGDFSDPPAWPGWSHRRYWIAAVQRWNKNSDIPVEKMSEKILRSLGWELQADFEHIPESVLCTSAYLDIIIQVLNNKAGVQEDDEKRRAFKSAISENSRRRDETLAQFAVRRLQDFSKAAAFGVVIPNEFKATMLREGAGLNDQNMQNLASLLRDDENNPDAVAKALSRLDLRADRVTGFASHVDTQESYVSLPETEETLEGEEDDGDSLDEEQLAKEIEPLDLTEDQIHQVFAVLDSQKQIFKKRTWKQNKEFKAELKKERGGFTKGADSRSSRASSSGGGRPRMNKEQLKKITRCRRCLRKGHWEEDCTAPQKAPSKPVSAFTYSSSSGMDGRAAFTFITLRSLYQAVSHVKKVSPELPESWSFLSLPSGEAIVDTGATQDLIGQSALQDFRKVLASHGLQPVMVDAPITLPAGIGGVAKASGVVLIPIVFQGNPGVLEMTVIEEPIPPLLSVGFLEFLGVIIDLPKNEIRSQKLQCSLPLTKLPSGHRTMQMLQWGGTAVFEMPEELIDKYQLKPDSFHLKPLSAYTKEAVLENVLVNSRSHEPNLQAEGEGQVVHGSSAMSELGQSNLLGSLSMSQPHGAVLHGSGSVDHPSSFSRHDCCEHELSLEVDGTCHSLEPLRCEPQTTGSTLSFMGNFESLPQFDRLSIRCHGTRLSNEPRCLESQSPTMVQPHGDHPESCRGEPPELQGLGESRETEEYLVKSNGICGGRHSVSLEVPSSHRSSGQPIESVCIMDGLHSVSSPTYLHIQEKGCAQEFNHNACKSIIDANLDSSEGKCHPTGSADGRAGNGIDAGAAIPTRTGPHADQPLSARTGPGPVANGVDGISHASSVQPAEHDAGTAHSGPYGSPDGRGDRLGECDHIGKSDLARVPGESKHELTKHGVKWPRWMTRSLATTACVISWFQCSSEMQSHLAGWEQDVKSVVLHYNLDEGIGQDNITKDYEKHFILEYEQKKDAGARLLPPECHDHKECLGVGQQPKPTGSYFLESDSGKVINDRKCARPKWLPEFMQSRCQMLEAGDELYDVPRSWQVFWLKVEDSSSGNILENGPCDRQKILHEWRDPSGQRRDVMLTLWGLPAKFASLLQLSDDDCRIVGFDSDGVECEKGPFRTFKATNLNTAEMEEEMSELSCNQHDGELNQCHKALSWLARRSAQQTTDSRLDFVELFSPPRVVPFAQRLGLRTDSHHVFDLSANWDVREKKDRQKFRQHQRQNKPKMLMASPDCGAFSQLRHIYRLRMNPRALAHKIAEGNLMWDFSIEAAERQLEDNNMFGLEHPSGAASWSLPQTQKLLRRDNVALMTFDMCSFSLSVKEGTVSQKSTKLATSNPWLAFELLNKQCSHDHVHEHLISGLPRKAQIYSEDFCKTLASCTLQGCILPQGPSFLEYVKGNENSGEQVQDAVFFGDEEEDEPGLNETPLDSAQAADVPLTEAQRRLVQKVHINTGHPDRTRMLRAFKAAGALPRVLKFIKEEFSCEDCDLKKNPDSRRRAQLPRTFSFNHILSIDYLYVKFKELSVPILNMVDVGTSCQVAVRVPIPEGNRGGTPTSATTWKHFVESWQRYFGLPQVVICDAGNEFKALFERGLELAGVYQHVILPECPWQNGKAERHGGWLKDRLDAEIHGGRCSFGNLSELDEFLASLTAVKNRWLNRGGYTPSQLVFGQLPRIPGELLSEDDLGLHGMHDAYNDPAQVDEAAGEYRRRHGIRERARQLAMQQSSREAIKKATHTSHQQQRRWAPGQWVYVFRKAKSTQDLHLRDRWVGPGLVITSNNDTIYVGMRTRLWRCSPGQLRAALPGEILGRELLTDPGLAELLRRVVSGSHAGAVDVAREGPPPGDAEFGPVQRQEDGISTGDQRVLDSVAPPQAGINQIQPVDPVPADLSRRISSEAVDAIDRPADRHVHRAQENTPMSSRRSSIEEPAAEPQASTTPMRTISEEEEFALEPPAKVARRDEGPSGSSMNVSVEQPTRAPGTPVDRLLSNVPRASSPPMTPSPPPGLTPAENIPVAGRVAQQVEEFNRLSQGGSGELLDAEDNFISEGWSGTFFNYCRGDEHISLKKKKKRWSLVTAPKRNGEVSLKELSEEEKKLFSLSDQVEWEAIIKTGAVKVLIGKEAEEMRMNYPDRIVSSRMVRRKKPQPEVHSWKAKSRWCLHGHHDPDTGSLQTYAPTPSTEGLMLFLQTGLNLDMVFSFADVRNAFCQSDKLKRARGPLFAEPCEGLSLPPKALIKIEIPVYGLDDAPASWRATVTNYVVKDLGFCRNLVEPCWFSLYGKDRRPVAQLLVEVDDFVIAAKEDYAETLKEQLMSRFTFGKWEKSEAEYAGRRIKCTKDCIYVNQSKYIIEQVHAVPLARGRRQQKESKLTKEEFEALRSLVFKLNWLGRESRPEASGIASIMASRLPHAVIEDVSTVNKFANYLRSTADREIKIWKFNPKEMVFIVCSDAGGISMKANYSLDEEGLPTDATQGAWMVLTAEKLPRGRTSVRASPITWRSSKLKRKVFSTFGGETQAMLQGVNEVDWLQVMYRDAVFNDVSLSSWRNSLSPHMLVLRGECELADRQGQCSVVDAKSLYDCLLRENPSGKQDRKSSLELAIVLRDLQSTKSMVRWVPHQKMVVDPLTKMDPVKANDAMNQLIKSGWLSLVDVNEELANRKNDVAYRRRSHAASERRLLSEYEEQAFCLFTFLLQILVDNNRGDCKDCAVESMNPFDQKS